VTVGVGVTVAVGVAVAVAAGEALTAGLAIPHPVTLPTTMNSTTKAPTIMPATLGGFFTGDPLLKLRWPHAIARKGDATRSDKDDAVIDL
jgi:hypothetical protein